MANLSRKQVLEIISRAPPGTSAAGIVSALRQQGHTLEGHAQQAPEIRKPIPALNRAAHQALGMLPPTLGLAGGVLAVPAGPAGMAVGGGVGAASGRVLQQLGEQALGYGLPRSATEQLFGLPAALRQPVDVAEQGLLGAVIEGIPTSLSAGLGRFALARRSKAAEQAVKRARTIAEQSTIAPEIRAEIQAAKQARQVAGEAKGEALKAEGKVTLDDLAEHVERQQKESFGVSLPRDKILVAIKNRRKAIVRQHSGGARRGKDFSETLEQADLSKRAFGDVLRGKFGQGERGITQMPGLDQQIWKAYDEILTVRNPAIKEANEAAQRAIRTHQDVLRLGRLERSEPVQRLKQLKTEKTAAAAATVPGPGFHIGISGGLGGPRVYPHAPKIADLADAISRAMSSPYVRYSPDVVNFLVRSMTNQEPDTTAATPR